jgi:hypothetical protein
MCGVRFLKTTNTSTTATTMIIAMKAITIPIVPEKFKVNALMLPELSTGGLVEYEVGEEVEVGSGVGSMVAVGSGEIVGSGEGVGGGVESGLRIVRYVVNS